MKSLLLIILMMLKAVDVFLSWFLPEVLSLLSSCSLVIYVL